MKTRLHHVQFNVRPENVGYYRELLEFLGWQTLHHDETTLGAGAPSGESLWFLGIANEAANDYDGCGMNHVAIGAESQAEVDQAAAYLRERDIPALFDTPRHRPEFTWEEGQTYYQVMFESPDRILFEVVYTGPTAA